MVEEKRMETENENEMKDGGSLRERAKESMVRRKKQVRTRIVLLNAEGRVSKHMRQLGVHILIQPFFYFPNGISPRRHS